MIEEDGPARVDGEEDRWRVLEPWDGHRGVFSPWIHLLPGCEEHGEQVACLGGGIEAPGDPNFFLPRRKAFRMDHLEDHGRIIGIKNKAVGPFINHLVQLVSIHLFFLN